MARLRIVFREWSQLSRSLSIPFALPTQTPKGRGRVSPTTAHLVLSPSVRREDVLAMCPNVTDTTISRQCLTCENDATFRTGVLSSSLFPSHGVALSPVPRLGSTARGAHAAPAPYERLLPGGCCWCPGWESAATCSQQKTELMTFSCLIS